jgi:hypothetical protein
MKSTIRAMMATLYGDKRNAGGLVLLLSARQPEDTKLNTREKAILWGIVYGSVRTTKNLRGMRLSLVPRPDTRGSILQSL